MTQGPITACFGDRCVDAVLTELVGYDRVPTASLVVASFGKPVDLSSVVRLIAVGSGRQDPTTLFTGYVLRAEIRDDSWHITASSAPQLSERILPGFFVRAEPAEHFWSITRVAGYRPEELNVHSWYPSTETFAVIAPVRGINIAKELVVGPVKFTTDERVSRAWDGANPALRASISSAGLWAVVSVRTRTLYDAEVAGLALINAAVDRLSLAARFSLSVTPNGAMRAHRRERWLERVEVLPVVGVLGMESQREWLREQRSYSSQAVLDASILDGLGSEWLTYSDQTLLAAIRAWRRACSESDSSSTAVALYEALEFYAAGTSAGRLFSDEDLTKLPGRFGEDWSDPQRSRIAEVLERLNDAPFRVRLEAALEADRVPLSGAEARLLARLRTVRNDLVHGRQRGDLHSDDLQLALSVVARALVFRLARLGPARAPSPER